MAGSSGSIFVDVLLKDAQYVEGLKRSKKNTAQFGSDVNAITGSVADGFGEIAAKLAAVLSVAGLAEITKKSIEFASSLKDTSERLQVTTDDLQKYQFAAKLVGIEAETLEAGLTKLNAKIADGKYKYDNTTEALVSIAEATKNARTDTERLAIVNDAFGAKMGSKFLPLLKDGAEGLKLLGDEAFNTGNVINNNTIEAADKLGDRFDALASTIKNNFTQGLLDEFIEQSSDIEDIWKDPAFAETVQEIGQAFGYIAGLSFKGVQTLVDSIRSLPDDLDFLKSLEYQGFDIKNPNKPLFAPPKKPALPPSIFPDPSQLPEIPDYVPDVKKFVPTDQLEKNKKAADEIQKLYEKNESLITGLSKAQLTYNQQVEDFDKLLKAGTITQDQYTAAVGRASEELEKATNKGALFAFDTEAAVKRAAENIQDTLADFLFDPFDKGIKGMLSGIIDVFKRMAAEAAAANILGALFGDGKGGAGLFGDVAKSFMGQSGSDPVGGFLGKIFGGFFADGGYLGPGQYGVVGEAGPELIYGGKSGIDVKPMTGGGGNTYYIDARGADQAAIPRLEKAIVALAGPGVIEQRVMNAQKRGAL